MALAAADILWGLSFLFGNWALEEMGPAHVTPFHFSLAVAGPGASNDWLGKRLSDGYPAVPAWILTFGTLILTPVALVSEGMPRLDLAPLGWASVVILGLGCSAATYTLWNWGLARVPTSHAGVFLDLEPLVGALLGVLVLGEAWSPGTAIPIIGAAVVDSRRSGM